MGARTDVDAGAAGRDVVLRLIGSGSPRGDYLVLAGTARDERAAYAAGAAIAGMIADGTWVPHEMEQPSLPGARIDLH